MNYITKNDYITALNKIINPIKDELYRCNGKPVYGFSAALYNDNSVYAEGFLRPLWGLVPLWHGGHGDDDLKEAYRKGIINGTNPDSDFYWGLCNDYDQRFVEMAALAYALLFAPDVIWEPLSKSEKNNLVLWLSQINHHIVCDNNWRFFRVLVNTALKHLGENYDESQMITDLSRFDDFYLGNGWYMDGPIHQKDYYISMAIHFYSLIYATVENDEYAKKFRERAKLFAKDFIYWFADDGSALPYGRSLIYRFAQGAFWSMCLVAGVDVFDIGTIKGIISRHISDWLNAPIFDNGGVLTIGYKYPNLLMAEHYNAPGSPYWGLKFFALLALNDNNSFWDADIKPMPQLNQKKLIREADMLIRRYDGDVFAYPAGTCEQPGCGQMTTKYLKFAYSTRFGFNVKFSDAPLEEACTDSMLIFNIGGVYCERRFSYSFELNENTIMINWSPIKGIRIKTEINPDISSHTRKHIIESDYDCIAYDCGFAVACRDTDNCITSTGKNFAQAQNTFCGCLAQSECGEPIIISAMPNTNIIFNKTVIPSIKYRIPKGRSEFISIFNIK